MKYGVKFADTHWFSFSYLALSIKTFFSGARRSIFYGTFDTAGSRSTLIKFDTFFLSSFFGIIIQALSVNVVWVSFCFL